MAAIGIVLTFAFAIVAVAKKAADVDEKMKQSHGQILRSMLRSILIIVSLNIVITIVVAATNALMMSINRAFDEATIRAEGSSTIVYTDEQYAAMARIFNTVGNYSLNPSYNNRYNINNCYNEIRVDLKYLGDTHVFNFDYNDEDKNGNKINTWQSVLQDLANASDYNKDINVDEYNAGVSIAMNRCMTVLKTDPNFEALSEYERDDNDSYKAKDIHLDRILFLIGTMGLGDTAAAQTDLYNENPSFSDNVRRPYYTGAKNIYDFDQVIEDFDISFTKTNYIVVYFAAIAIITNMIMVVVNCIVRLFNLLFMYMIAPPIIAVSPLDDGAKLKQWLTAFIVQAFSVFANVISMKIFLLYIPIVMSPSLVLSSNNLLNAIGKLIMIWAGIKAIEKADGILTGILADNAGWQSIQAGNMRDTVKNSKVGKMASGLRESFENKFAGTAKGVAKAPLKVAGFAFSPVTGAISNVGQKAKNWGSNVADKWRNSIVSSPEQEKQAAEKKQKDAEQTQLADKIVSGMKNAGIISTPPPPRPNNPNQQNQQGLNQQNQQGLNQQNQQGLNQQNQHGLNQQNQQGLNQQNQQGLNQQNQQGLNQQNQQGLNQQNQQVGRENANNNNDLQNPQQQNNQLNSNVDPNHQNGNNNNGNNVNNNVIHQNQHNQNQQNLQNQNQQNQNQMNQNQQNNNQQNQNQMNQNQQNQNQMNKNQQNQRPLQQPPPPRQENRQKNNKNDNKNNDRLSFENLFGPDPNQKK